METGFSLYVGVCVFGGLNSSPVIFGNGQRNKRGQTRLKMKRQRNKSQCL